MNILDIIDKKRNGQKLSQDEIQFFVDGVCNNSIKDYQTTSLLMAICLNGLDFDETYNLTISMANSGERVNLDDVGECVDKHSTGGVSDTTTLCVVPILASLGVKVAKMSGRSLGFTGGTADKVEVFKGYKTEISIKDFKNLIKENNASIVSQSKDLAIADKIIYKLRSDSGTVENMGLIASSIMSKKLACGAKTILLDCKYGNGAFMKTPADAKELAKIMVRIGKKAGMKVCAVISNMEQPLTNYVGNNLEVYSSLEVLNGVKNDLSKLSVYLASKILVLVGKAKNIIQAKKMAQNAIDTKLALNKLKQIVLAQGGSVTCIDKPEALLKHKNEIKVFSKTDGYVYQIDTSLIGNLSHLLQYKSGKFVRQYDVGLILNKRIGDEVNTGELLLTCNYNSLDNAEEIGKMLNKIYNIGDKKVTIKLVDGVIE